ncbi:MAG: fumarylacetoacetate hydrolase, partial [Rhodospirillales bacterium]
MRRRVGAGRGRGRPRRGPRRAPDRPWFLAPGALQAVTAAGVTFARSMLERVIEEQARGSRERAEA